MISIKLEQLNRGKKMTTLKIKRLNSNLSASNLSEQHQTSVVGGQSDSERYWGYYANGQGDIIDVNGSKRLVSSKNHKSSNPIVLVGNNWVDVSKVLT
jgi:hypothetical protein